MDRLRYHGRRAASAFLHWARRRFTSAGGLVLGALVASAVLGVDTNASMAYQAFTFLLALLALSMSAGLLFRARLEVRRTVPRFGTAGQPLPYSIRVKELGGRAQRDLSLFEELEDPRPDFDAFRRERRVTRHFPIVCSGSAADRLVRHDSERHRDLFAGGPPLGVCEASAQLIPRRGG